MEDNISFDVWGRVVEVARRAAYESMIQLGASSSLREAMRANARAAGGLVLIGKELSWDNVVRVRARGGLEFDSLAVFQSGYGPLDVDRLHACSIHRICFAGVLGCPVCSRRV